MANGEAPSKLTEYCTKIYQNYENCEKKPDFERKMNFENRVYVRKKSLVYLWSFLIFYLTLGAVIISQIEKNNEVSELNPYWQSFGVLTSVFRGKFFQISISYGL